ncbi:DUF3307 domain-containing protein [Candidatus Peregrinibacteria bacterium]|nr:DUF3307 domain-containing protein [Candidatus Peregrinibacteria bacterium]
MVILYLILAHLLADFVFQPSKLVKWKVESAWGVIIHSAIHVVVSAILIFPYLNLETALIIFGLGVIHAVIDFTKISISIKSDKFMAGFIIDQMCHLITVVGAGMGIGYLNNWQNQTWFFPNIYNNHLIVLFLILLVFMSYTVEIYRHTTKMRSIGEEARFHYKEMFLRVMVLTFVYMIFTAVAYITTIL